MRWLCVILCFISCSSKRVEKKELVGEDTLIIWQSKTRTEQLVKALEKADTIIKVEKERVNKEMMALKESVSAIKQMQSSTKVIYVHDTIIIDKKTNFWGKVRVRMDSIKSIDSTEYQ